MEIKKAKQILIESKPDRFKKFKPFNKAINEAFKIYISSNPSEKDFEKLMTGITFTPTMLYCVLNKEKYVKEKANQTNSQ